MTAIWLELLRVFPVGLNLLRDRLSIEPEQRLDAQGRVYLGCRQVVAPINYTSGGLATTMAYHMTDLLKTCLARYLELAGSGIVLRNYSSHLLAEVH